MLWSNNNMSFDTHQIVVNGLPVQVVRKAIKNLHLGVYPPHGRVRVAAPFRVGDEAVRLAVLGKLGWIRRQKLKFESQPRQSRREMVSGETHYVFGTRCRLNVVEQEGAAAVSHCGKKLILQVRPGTGMAQRERILQDWYRKELKALIPPLLAKWQPVIAVEAAAWGVKRMKTMWGACNPATRRLWVNLELAKKSFPCLEYIIVHALVHLIAPHHDARFVALMDRFLPRWQVRRKELNAAPLPHAEWAY